MMLRDIFIFGLRNLLRYRLRSGLIILAMSVGVIAIISLTALGEGARQFVLGEFASLGNNIVIVLPGKNETTGGSPPLSGEIARDLSIEDAQSLLRIPAVVAATPIIVGSGDFSVGAKQREVLVIGTTASYQQVRTTKLAAGQFLPEQEWDRGSAFVVIGKTVQEELFGHGPALGEHVRIGDRRFRVSGILASGGQSMDINMDEVAMISVATAQQVFNRSSLFRILLTVNSRSEIEHVKQAVVDILRERHEGEEDVTVLTQDAIMATFDKVLSALTAALGGIAAISIVVAGILIMNVTLITVTQRTAEIGLLKALGANASIVRQLILVEAALLSLAGALAGLLLGYTLVALARHWYPSIPFAVPAWASISALSVALFAGVLFAFLPANKASKLDPVLALSKR